METISVIPKEELTGLQYAQTDVYKYNPQKQALRKYQVQRALSLGNLYQTKVKIRFRDHQGVLRVVETTIWSVFEEYISLKGGKLIPMRAIEEIEF